MEYEMSIRINFPADISETLRSEKDRFVAEYGSRYKSEPHITLYLDRYTKEGFSFLIPVLRELQVEPFEITLLAANVNLEPKRHRNLYVVDFSNKEPLRQLHHKIKKIAASKSVEMLEDSQSFDPHITLGAVDLDARQPNLAEVQKNIGSLKGKKITISSFSAALYGKQNSKERFELIEKVEIPLQ